MSTCLRSLLSSRKQIRPIKTQKDLRTTRGTLPGSACRTCLRQKGHRQIWSATWSQFRWNRLETLEWNDCRVGTDTHHIAAEYTRRRLAIHCLSNQEEKGTMRVLCQAAMSSQDNLGDSTNLKNPPHQNGQTEGTVSVRFRRSANSGGQDVEPKPKHELRTRKVRASRILNRSAVDMQ